jgi:hypothetical protein
MNSREFKNQLTSVAPEVPARFHDRVEMTLENIVTQEAQMKENTRRTSRGTGRFTRRTAVIALALILVLAAAAVLRIPAAVRGGRVFYRLRPWVLLLLCGGLWGLCRLLLDRFARHRGRELTELTLVLGSRSTVCRTICAAGRTTAGAAFCRRCAVHFCQCLTDRFRRRVLDADVVAGACGFLIEECLERIRVFVQNAFSDRLPRVVRIGEHDDARRPVRFVDQLPGLPADAKSMCLYRLGRNGPFDAVGVIAALYDDGLRNDGKVLCHGYSLSS